MRVVDVFPEDSHPPITYALALTARAPPKAAQLVEFLTGDAARQIFVRYGFTAPPGRRHASETETVQGVVDLRPL